MSDDLSECGEELKGIEDRQVARLGAEAGERCEGDARQGCLSILVQVGGKAYRGGLEALAGQTAIEIRACQTSASIQRCGGVEGMDVVDQAALIDGVAGRPGGDVLKDIPGGFD